MMRALPRCATEDEILAVAHEWLSLAVDDRYEDAMELLAEEDEPVPVDDVRELVRNYGAFEAMRDGSTYRITDPSTARGSKPGESVNLVKIGNGARGANYRGEVCMPAPLDGEWSDLVIRFAILERDNHLVLALSDIDVP